MPLFDYKCDSCSHQFEALQGVNDTPLVKCPECETDSLKKLVSAPAFTFKGSGWYKDLYASTGAGSKSESGAAGESTKNTSSESSTSAASSSSSDASTSSAPKASTAAAAS